MYRQTHTFATESPIYVMKIAIGVGNNWMLLLCKVFLKYILQVGKILSGYVLAVC